jgi:DNA-binding MurR/RpiR family transcriptional regulator
MEVRIGVVYTPKELSMEFDGKAEEVIKTVEAALNDGAPVLWLADKKGRRIGIPSDKVAYVEITEEDAVQRVGFGTG